MAAEIGIFMGSRVAGLGVGQIGAVFQFIRDGEIIFCQNWKELGGIGSVGEWVHFYFLEQ